MDSLLDNVKEQIAYARDLTANADDSDEEFYAEESARRCWVRALRLLLTWWYDDALSA